MQRRIITMWLLIFLLSGSAYAVVEQRHKPGHIMSPNYPQIYPPLQNKTWIFKRQTGKWAVTFEDFDLQESKECTHDFLFLRDLHDWSHSIKLCGGQKPRTFQTRTSGLQIDFHSDWIMEGRGFKADVMYGKDTATLEYQINPRTGRSMTGPADREETALFTVMIVSVVCLAVVLLALGSFTLFYLLKYKRRDGVAVWISRNGAVDLTRKRKKKLILKKYSTKSKTDVNGNGLFRLQSPSHMHKMIPNPSYVYNATSPKHMFVRYNSEDNDGERGVTEPYTDIKFVELAEKHHISSNDV